MWFKLLAVSLTLVFMSGCGSLFGYSCEDACENGNELCTEIEADCATVCESDEDPTDEEQEAIDCVAEAETCEAVAACGESAGVDESDVPTEE